MTMVWVSLILCHSDDRRHRDLAMFTVHSCNHGVRLTVVQFNRAIKNIIGKQNLRTTALLRRDDVVETEGMREAAASTRKGQVRIYSSDIPEYGPTRPVTAVCQIIVWETGSAESRRGPFGEFFFVDDARAGRGWREALSTDIFPECIFRAEFHLRKYTAAAE